MPTTGFEVRRATAADAAVLAHHRVAMFRDMGKLDPQLEPELIDRCRRRFEQVVPAGEYLAWLVYPSDDPSKIVCGGGVQLRTLYPRTDVDGMKILDGPEAIVLNVYCEPEYRRRGLARMLMEAILAWAKTAGIVRLVLHASDEGRPLYESIGFEPTNEMRYTGPLA